MSKTKNTSSTIRILWSFNHSTEFTKIQKFIFLRYFFVIQFIGIILNRKKTTSHPDASLSPDGMGGIPTVPPTAVPTNPIPRAIPPTPPPYSVHAFQKMKLEKMSRLEQEGIDEVSPLSRGVDSRLENAAATTNIPYKTIVMKHQSQQNARKQLKILTSFFLSDIFFLRLPHYRIRQTIGQSTRLDE